MTNPLISVIICTYNTKTLTLICLDNLKKSIAKLGKPVETIVIENGNDGTGKLIKKEYPWVKLIEPKENTGFAKGNNLGIRSANKNSKYYLLLNSDALIKEETLTKAVAFMENHKVDVLGCKLLLEDGTLQASGGYLPNPISVVAWIWGLDLIPVINTFLRPVHPKNKSLFDENNEFGWVMGAFLFLKKEVIEATKGMDENLFMYMEEVEWCKRIRDSGFSIWYTPSFEITHLDKASSKADPSKIKQIFKTEILGIIYYLKKYYNLQLFWLIPAIRIGLIARIIAFSLIGNNMRKVAYLETLKAI